MSNKTYWVKIAEYDLGTAQAMLESKRFLYVGFMCHQSIEKILKAIYTAKYETVPPRIHNLAMLLKINEINEEIPVEYLEIIHELNPLNIATRYPEQELDILKEMNQNYVSGLLKKTRRLFKWLKTKIK